LEVFSLKRIELKEQKEHVVSKVGVEITEFIYYRYVIVLPPSGLSYTEIRKVVVTCVNDLKVDEGNQFKIDYLGAVEHIVTPLGSYNRDDAILPMSEIEAYCEGVDAAYENIFDKLYDYLPVEKTDEIYNHFWNKFEQDKLITKLKGEKH